MQKANYIFLKIAVGLIALCPFKLLFLISDVVAWVFLYIIKYRYKVVRANLQNAFPENNSDTTKQIAAGFYRHFCDMMLESLKGLTLSKAELQKRFVYSNPEIFDELFQQGKSAILLGSHYGNWEWGVLSVPLVVKHTVAGIYKPIKNRMVDAYVNKLRTQYGLHLVNMAQAGRAIVQYREHPTIFVLIADQTPIDVRNAHWVNFLHQDTPFLHGADKLARQTGYPVFMVDIHKVKRGYYEVVFSLLSDNPEKKAAGEITAMYARKLEKLIKNQPEYWLWSHRRWKRKRKQPAQSI